MRNQKNKHIFAGEFSCRKAMGDLYFDSQQIRVKKDDDLLSGNHLETQNINSGGNIRGNMPVNVDNQPSADITQVWEGHYHLSQEQERQFEINHPRIYRFLKKYGEFMVI